MNKVLRKGFDMMDVIATVAYDSWTHEVPELRSTRLPDRHLIFEGNGLILDLMLRKHSGSTSILIGGQILPRGASLTSVAGVEVLMKQGPHRSSTRTNALGEFAFHAVPHGSVDLVITLKEHRFIVRSLLNEEPRSWEVVAASAAKG